MISVCIATFNGEKFIKEQLLSILNQISLKDEVIISDNGSSDRTLDIINKLADERIKLFINPINNGGLVGNFQNALSKSSGDIIFLSDQDDIWDPNKVSIFQEYLKNYDLVCSNASLINEKGVHLNKSFFEIIKPRNGFLKNLIRNSYLGCCMAFHRSVLQYSLPFPEGLPMHDWWIGLIGELHFKTIHVKNELTHYRRHSNNASTTASKSSNTIYRKIKMRVIIVKSLVKKYIKA